jgi:hypothetical protein
MFFNIIIFFIILIILTLILHYSSGYKEGFFNFPVAEHNTFVDDSAKKYNLLTNTINLINPAVPVTPDNSNALKVALQGLSIEHTSTTPNLSTTTDFNIPSSTPNSFQQANYCEKVGATCSAFDDPTFAANCGISFDNKGVGANGKPHIGGLFISDSDRQKQSDLANDVLSTGASPYDPYKVYQPTLGKSKPGTFAITKDQCIVVKEKIDCATKQTFNSPNCSQCYTSQTFARVGPETERIPSTLFITGNGSVAITTPESTNPSQISLSQTNLGTNPIQVTIPGNSEGTVFIINVQSNSSTTPTYLSGFIQGQTPRGTFKLDLFNLVQSDLVTNSKPKLNGSVMVNGFRCLSMVPGNNQTSMNLSCLMPFSFLSIYDGDALTCDNGPIITQAASATFLESDPCFGKDNKPGNYKLECLQSRWIELGGTPQGTGYPSNQKQADLLQKDDKGNPLDIDTILNTLGTKMNSAQTGKDANGKPLTIADWNDVSMWATGTPINTPCDGPNKDNGPLSQECLSYLYLNQGVTSHIGPTYTMSPSQVASMKGQTTPNTFCQPGAPLDPATPTGLKFGQSLGGINAVKQSYDQINRLANDNTKRNSDRQTAVEQCYGVTLGSFSFDDSIITQKVFGNNGSVSCDTYCQGTDGGPWGNELPKEWNGAKCVSTSPDIPNCNSKFTATPNSYCVCGKTGTGWYYVPPQKTYRNDGTVSCSTYCGGTGGGPWNNELPAEWNGARCIGTSPDIKDCNSTFSYTSNTYCICDRTGTGWN